MEKVFSKLHSFIGGNVKSLIDRPDELYCFRLQKNKVYYVSEQLVRRATSVARDHLVSLGTCIGKFTKSGHFRLTITAMEILAAYAKHKLWLKPAAEMSFLYGNHVLKSGLAKITEGTPANAGVVVFSMSDVPLGFGVTAKGTTDCRKLDPTAMVCLHQADVGEYLRAEEEM